MENKFEKIIAYFEENTKIFDAAIEELDSYMGYLGDDRYFEMDLLDEFYHSADPLELLHRAYFGYDEDVYTTNGRGDREYGQFNPNRDYFKYNGYGNLVSTDYKDYSAHLDEYAISAMIEYRDHIDLCDELIELFDALDEE